jgi:sorting nexin-3/12
MNQEENLENQSICRLATKKQSLDDMYSVPANFLEIDVINPQTTIIAGKKKYTDYEIRMRVSLNFLKFRSTTSLSHSLLSAHL